MGGRKLGHIVGTYVHTSEGMKALELDTSTETPIHDQLCAEYGVPNRGTSQPR